MRYFPRSPSSASASAGAHSIPVVAIALAIRALLLSVAPARTPPPPSLKIVVVEGEGAINNIRAHRAKDPVVLVVDGKNMPVKGAAVTFVLPDTGPSGEFGEGIRTLAVVTDGKGQAIGRGLTPNSSIGGYQIRVVASHLGKTASTVIDQTNAEPARSTARRPGKKLILLSALGGAAAAGLALAVRGHGTSTPASSVGPPPVVISAGTPNFQTPH